MAKGRTVIIGLDGVPYEMIMKLAASGAMPNLQKVIESGGARQIRSTVPDISSVAWSSIITGCDAGTHGVFGFTDLVRGTYQIRFPNFTDLKAPTFWEKCSGPSVIINVPSTYPVRAMNGVHVSGFISIEMAKAVYPPTLVSRLQQMDYRLDVDSQKAHSDMRLFLDDVQATLRSNVMAYQYLWDHPSWRNFMLVFTTTDRLLHFLWDAWEDETHIYHVAFVDHFRAIDRVIGEISGRLGSDDNLLLLSDHGFERLDKDIYLNRLLIDKGLLQFEPGKEAAPINIATGTQAFVLDPGRIYIHLQGRYPKGSVRVEEKEAVIGRLTELFGALEVDGRKVIKGIRRREDVYTGPYANDGPDVVLMANPGFNLKGAMAAPSLAGCGVFSGMHSYANAFVVSQREDVLAGFDKESSVIDVGAAIGNLVMYKADQQ